jgi:L-fuconolactonase
MVTDGASGAVRSPVVDTHQHFWAVAVPEYDSWMTGQLAALRGRHLPADLEPVIRAAGVDYTLAVQTFSSLAETQHYLKLADENDFVAGVVGWAPVTAPDLASVLTELQSGPHGRWLRGIRTTVDIDESPAWFSRPDVRRGLEIIGEHDLVFDLLLRPDYLAEATAAAAAVPGTKFVINHLAKPDYTRDLEPWSRDIARAAQLPNVACKISGLVSEAPATWSARDFLPWITVVAECFGADRIVFGSDWPIFTVDRTYQEVLSIARDCVAKTFPDALASFLGGNAASIYQLPLPTDTAPEFLP